jgi:pectate lyase
LFLVGLVAAACAGSTDEPSGAGGDDGAAGSSGVAGSGVAGSGAAGSGVAGSGVAGSGAAGSGVAGSGVAGAAGRGGAAGTGTAGAAGTGAAGRGGAAGTGTAGAAGTGMAGRGGAAGTGTAGRGGAAGTGTAGAAGTGTAGAAGTGTAGAGGCMNPPAASPLVGWAAVDGMGTPTTTGGGTAAPMVVTTQAAFTSAIGGTTARVIHVNGNFTGNFGIGSNKTIIGVCGAELHGHIGVSNASNVIIRNLKIVGYGVGNCALDPSYDSSVGCSSGADAVSVSNSHHVWFDHCDVSDGTDGNLDINNGSDFVTISWTKFHYSPRTDNSGNDSTGASGHRFSNLIGSADDVPADVGHLNITWHHDWWADNVNQRMPRSRNGKIHLYNNLFTSVGNSYCTNAGFQTHLLVENNVYNGVKNPLQPDANGDMLARGNQFTGTSGTTTANGTGFTPPYQVTLEAVSGVQAAVMAGAGPK